MNRKAFVRSIEAVIAIILFVSFYRVATQDLNQQIPRADPTVSASTLLDSLEQSGILNSYVNTYSLKELTTSLKYLLAPTQGFKVELNYLEPLTVKNNNNFNITRNITFVRFLPETANINSINVLDNNGRLLSTQVVNNYYLVKISVQTGDEIINNTITLASVRLRTEGEAINTTSLVVFAGSKVVPARLNTISYNSNYYDANASITVMVPYASKNSVINLFLFFAGGEAGQMISYPSLSEGAYPAYSAGVAAKSKACEIRFAVTLEPNEEKNAMLYYELNTESERTFPELSVNNEGVSVSARSDYFESTNPLTSYQSSNTYNVRKTILTSDLNCLINLKVWNYE